MVSTDSVAPFEANVTLPVGVTSVTLGATAIDFGNNVGAATDVVVNVVRNPRPTVAITSPVAGADVIEGSTISIEADATDDVGVTRVDFTVGGAFAGSDSAAP